MRKQRIYFVGTLGEESLLQGDVATIIGKDKIDFAQPLTLQGAERVLGKQIRSKGERKLHLYKVIHTTLDVEKEK